MAVEAVSVFEGLVADGAGHGALDAVHRLEVAPVHASDNLQNVSRIWVSQRSPRAVFATCFKHLGLPELCAGRFL